MVGAARRALDGHHKCGDAFAWWIDDASLTMCLATGHDDVGLVRCLLKGAPA